MSEDMRTMFVATALQRGDRLTEGVTALAASLADTPAVAALVREWAPAEPCVCRSGAGL